MNWFRWYVGTATDPKFLVVSRLAGQNVAAVVAVWAMLLERASDVTKSDATVTQCDAVKRGFVTGFDCEAADAVLGLEDGASEAILRALKQKGLLSGEKVTNWEKRQPKREDSSTERTRAYRERLREKQAVTQCDAVKRGVTLEENREEYIKLNTPLSPLEGGAVQGKPARVKVEYPSDFEAFWTSYPRKQGKDAALRAWKTKKRERRLPELPVLLAAIEAAKYTEQWQRDGGQYIPQPATWLNQGRWLDESEEMKEQQRMQERRRLE